MSAWRRLAIERFPNLRRELHSHNFTVYMLFFELRSMLPVACATGDHATMDSIIAFAQWCVSQKQRSFDLCNAAVTAFFEHVFEDCADWDRVLTYLRPQQIEEWWPLWAIFMPADELKRLRLTVERRYGKRALSLPEPPYWHDTRQKR